MIWFKNLMSNGFHIWSCQSECALNWSRIMSLEDQVPRIEFEWVSIPNSYHYKKNEFLSQLYAQVSRSSPWWIELFGACVGGR